jgi:hypothetical protein
MGIRNGTQTGKGTNTRTLCQKIERSAEPQLSWKVGLFTEHCHLKGRLFKLGLTDDPIGESRLEEDESATHVLCDCEAIAHLQFCHLGQFFMEPGDYYGAPLSKVLQFFKVRD